MDDATTLADTANPSRYLLAGNLGYCINDPARCQAGSATTYNIVYDSSLDAFTVALLAEPLGATRAAAEAELAKVLGLSQSEMCRLNYYVGTTDAVSSFYAGKNLGFSFCRGTTKLPQ